MEGLTLHRCLLRMRVQLPLLGLSLAFVPPHLNVTFGREVVLHGWRSGSRAWLRTMWSKDREGSNPSPCTQGPSSSSTKFKVPRRTPG
jgi:hypothetical protein